MQTSVVPDQHDKKLRSVLPFVVFFLALVFTWYTSSVYAVTIMDSDSSSELVMANLLAHQNAVLTTDWFYSNELRVIQTNLVFAPLFKVFSNWHTVRLVGMIVLQMILLLSFYYLCRQAQLNRRTFLYSASILILPFSVQYGRIVLYHSYYIVFITLGFLIVGLYLSVVRQWSQPERTKKRVITALILLVTSFLSGLNGIRQMMITMLPLLIAAVLMTLKTERIEEGADGKPVWYRWKWLITGVIVCGFCYFGYLVNVKVLSEIYTYRSYEATTTVFITGENLITMLQDFFSQFGYQPNRRVFSIGGLLACGSLFAASYVILWSCRRLLSPNIEKIVSGRQTSAGAFIEIFAPVSILTTFVVFCFIKVDAHYFLYFIPAVVWIVPFLACRLETSRTENTASRALLLLTCAVFLGNGVFNNAYFINPGQQDVIYEGLGRKDIHTVQELQGAVNFLQKNQYTLGYATYWCSNVVTEMTNGEIPMVNVQVNTKNPAITYYNWLTDKRYRDSSFVKDKKVFLLLPINENDAFLSTPMADAASEVYQDDLYVIYDFEYSDDPWNALNEA